MPQKAAKKNEVINVITDDEPLIVANKEKATIENILKLYEIQSEKNITINSLSTEECKKVFDRESNKYIQLSHLISDIDHERDSCLIFLNQLQNAYKQLTTSTDSQPSISMNEQIKKELEKKILEDNMSNDEQDNEFDETLDDAKGKNNIEVKEDVKEDVKKDVKEDVKEDVKVVEEEEEEDFYVITELE